MRNEGGDGVSSSTLCLPFVHHHIKQPRTHRVWRWSSMDSEVQPSHPLGLCSLPPADSGCVACGWFVVEGLWFGGRQVSDSTSCVPPPSTPYTHHSIPPTKCCIILLKVE